MNSALQLERPDGTRVTLVGSLVDHLAPPTWPRVCITGERSRSVDLTASYVLEVRSVRLQGDGHSAPIVGTVERRRGAITLVDDSGHAFLVENPPDDLTTAVGHRVWLLARYVPASRRYAVLRFGGM